MLKIDAPLDFQGDVLGEELSAALGRPVEVVYMSGGPLTVDGVDEGDRQTVEEVVAGHVPPPPPPDPDDELVAAVEAASSLEELKAALTGGAGKSARAAARRPDHAGR